MSENEERIAKTEAVFREVNERIAETADRFHAEAADFVCECADPSCTTRIQASLRDYERVRSDPTHFLLAHGHEVAQVERIVQRRPGFSVVEKFNKTVAALVRQTDPRTEPA
jgi:hypothetical protein